MTYEEFKKELKRAKLSVKAFALLLDMNPTSITNYKRSAEIPRHLALIAILLAELTQHGVQITELTAKALRQ